MIKANERKNEPFEWCFPKDKGTENPTVFTLQPTSGSKQAYLRYVKFSIYGRYDYDDWKTDKILNGIQKVSNYENEKGKVVTLTKPEEINEFIEKLTEIEVMLLLATLEDKESLAYQQGVMEKN